MNDLDQGQNGDGGLSWHRRPAVAAAGARRPDRYLGVLVPARVNTAVDLRFAAELARLRRERDLSLRALASKVYQSKTLLHELENGQARPTVDLAGRLDVALDAGGKLAAMVQDSTQLPGDDADRLRFVTGCPRRIDAAAVNALEQVLAGQRQLEDSVGSAAVIVPVRPQLDLITTLLGDARDALRPRLVFAAAQWAQFGGWLHIATDDRAGARRWLSRALEWSTEADNPDLTATVLSFKGHLAEVEGRLGDMLGLSQAARRDPKVYAGLRAYTAGQEARGLAMTGAAPAVVLSRLDEAVDLAAEQAERGSLPPWGYWYSPGFFLVQQGIVYRHLGERNRHLNDRAIELLTSGARAVPADAVGADWHGWHLLDLGIAHGQAGDAAAARQVFEETRAIAETTRSAKLAGQVAAAVRKLGLSPDG